MGIDVAYFSAEDDAAAAEVEGRPGGPLGWPTVTGHRKVGLFRKEPVVVELGASLPGFSARGYDPVVNMATLEHLLTDRDLDDIYDDPRSGGAASEAEAPEDHGVITLTDPLRDALAASDDARLASVVHRWSLTDEFQQPWWEGVGEQEHLRFLVSLRDLSRDAASQGARLYCYFRT